MKNKSLSKELQIGNNQGYYGDYFEEEVVKEKVQEFLKELKEELNYCMITPEATIQINDKIDKLAKDKFGDDALGQETAQGEGK